MPSATIKRIGLRVSIACVALLAAGPAAATGTFTLVLAGTTDGTVTVPPGAGFALEVLVTDLAGEPGVQPNLDSFTYRVIFPAQGPLHVLDSSYFLPPFDGAAPPAGFNGGVPLGDVSVPIDTAADAGTPFATPIVRDLYRTTASVAGIPAAGSSFVVELLELVAPAVSGAYAIDLSVLEAADPVGAFHGTATGAPFVVTVPEPHALYQWAAGLVFVLLALQRRGQSLAAPSLSR